MAAAAAEGMRAQEDLAGWPCALPLALGARERQVLVELEGLKQAGGTPAPVLEGLQPAELQALTGLEQIFAAALVSLREPRAQVDPTTRPHE